MRLVVPRIAATVPLLFLVSLIIFSIPYFIPGDPAFVVAGPDATLEDVEAVREDLGLNQPLFAQYALWVANAVRFDFGTSYILGRDVSTMIAERMEVTFSIAVLSTIFAGAIGIPLGLIAATGIGRLRDRTAVVAASLGVAIPNYWLAAVLVTYLAVGAGLFPAAGYVRIGEDPLGWLRHLILPTVAVGAIAAAEVTRQTRARMAEVLQLEYVRTAQMKGLSPSKVLLKHAFKNAAIPVVTVLGLTLTVALGGAVIIERIFGMPGLGDLAITAVLTRDIPVLQGIVLFTTVVAVTTNAVVDVVTGYLDPRVSIS